MPDEPLLGEVGLGKFGRGRAADAQSVLDNLVADVPWMRFDRIGWGHHVPRGRSHGSGEGPGGSVADIPEEELLKGFGS